MDTKFTFFQKTFLMKGRPNYYLQGVNEGKNIAFF